MKLLKFEAEWCSGCKAQDELFKATPLDGAELVKLDVDKEENEELTAKYNIRSLPTMILLNDKDNEVTRWIGTQPVNNINDFIKSV